MSSVPADQLDPAAVSQANQQLWANHPELGGRQLTMEPEDTAYRQEWMRLYLQDKAKSKGPPLPPPPPSPETQPTPADPPAPVVADRATQSCSAVGTMTHEQKMEEAIKRAPISDAIRKQLGDIPTLVGMVVAVTGGLIALAATGYGAVAEAITAGLLVAGAAIGGYDVGGGIVSLIDFYQQTQCDTAQAPEDLDKAGKSFADAVAKMGVGGLTLALSFAGAEKLSEEPIPEGEVPPPLPEDIAATFENGEYSPEVLKDPLTVYRAEGQSYGRWFGTVKPSSAAEADQLYNISGTSGATLDSVSTYQIPAGTTIYKGPVAGGTGTQVFIDDPRGAGVRLLDTEPLPPD